MNIYNFIKNNFDENSIFFEIGSHFGTDTSNLLKITKKIHCFEPDPRNIEVFKGLNLPLVLNELAVSNMDGESDIYLSSGNVYDSPYGPTDNNFVNSRDWSASSSIKRPKNHLIRTPWVKFNKKIRIKTTRIDTYCEKNNIDRIDFIWMDTQGSELDIIEGMGKLKEKIGYIYSEYSNEELYEGQGNKTKILNSLGPNWEIIFDFGDDILLKNKKLDEHF